MKRILSIFIILSMVLALCACSDTKTISEETENLPKETIEVTESFDFDNYEYKFIIEKDGIALAVPSTLGKYLDSGLTIYEQNYTEKTRFKVNEPHQITMVTPSGEFLNVTLCNSTNQDLLLKDIFVTGISMNFGTDTEIISSNTKIYPSKTNATQKFLFPGISVEDAEIVLDLGTHSKLLETATLENENIIHKINYGKNDINATVVSEYGIDSGLLNISIDFSNLSSSITERSQITSKQTTETLIEIAEPQPGPAPMIAE